MALSKEAPEFDIDDEVLLTETGIAMESMSNRGNGCTFSSHQIQELHCVKAT